MVVSVRGRMLAGGVVLAGVLGLLWFADPSQSRLFPPCPVHYATGLYCPGCGSTRALHCLVHGDLPGAMAKNPLAVVSIPLIVVLCLRTALTRNRFAAWIALAILLAYTVLRNIDLYPFVLLAPH